MYMCIYIYIYIYILYTIYAQLVYLVGLSSNWEKMSQSKTLK